METDLPRAGFTLVLTLVTGAKVTHTHVEDWEHRSDGRLRVLGPDGDVIREYPAGAVREVRRRP